MLLLQLRVLLRGAKSPQEKEAAFQTLRRPLAAVSKKYRAMRHKLRKKETDG